MLDSWPVLPDPDLGNKKGIKSSIWTLHSQPPGSKESPCCAPSHCYCLCCSDHRQTPLSIPARAWMPAWSRRWQAPLFSDEVGQVLGTELWLASGAGGTRLRLSTGEWTDSVTGIKPRTMALVLTSCPSSSSVQFLLSRAVSCWAWRHGQQVLQALDRNFWKKLGNLEYFAPCLAALAAPAAGNGVLGCIWEVNIKKNWPESKSTQKWHPERPKMFKWRFLCSENKSCSKLCKLPANHFFFWGGGCPQMHPTESIKPLLAVARCDQKKKLFWIHKGGAGRCPKSPIKANVWCVSSRTNPTFICGNFPFTLDLDSFGTFFP